MSMHATSPSLGSGPSKSVIVTASLAERTYAWAMTRAHEVSTIATIRKPPRDPIGFFADAGTMDLLVGLRCSDSGTTCLGRSGMRDRFPLQDSAAVADIRSMTTRRASEPTSVVVGSALLCALTLGTGWLVLRGGSFMGAIAAMGVITVVFVSLLVQRPRTRR